MYKQNRRKAKEKNFNKISFAKRCKMRKPEKLPEDEIKKE